MAFLKQVNSSADFERPPAPTGRAAIVARDVSVNFGVSTAIRGISLTVGEGEHVAVIGPNGAGKTTLLRVLAGLIRPVSGSVLVHGRAWGSAETRAEIGLVAHQTLLYPELTAEENLHLYARLYGVERRSDVVAEQLTAVGLLGRRGHRVSTLSRGMTQRLSIARALLHDPSILLLDEPETGLDLEASDLLDQLVGSDGRRRTGQRAHTRTVVRTTHDLEHAVRTSDRIVLVASGRVVGEATSAHVGPDGIKSWVRAALSRQASRVPAVQADHYVALR